MDNQLDAFLRGIDAAACSWFDTYGGQLDTLGFALAVTPEPLSTKVGVGLMLANAAAQKGCTFDPNKQGSGTPTPGIKGCAETDGGADLVCYNYDGAVIAVPLPASSGVNKIISTTVVTSPQGYPQLRIDVGYTTGSTGYIFFPNYNSATMGYVALEPVSPVSCIRQEDTTGPILTPDDIPAYNYTDIETGCEMNITFKGYGEGPAGDVFQITQIEPATNGLRSSGGIISGCNFNPTIVINQVGGGSGGGGGGTVGPPTTFPTPIPVPPSSDDWWQKFAREALATVVGAYIQNVLQDLLAPPMPSSIYRMVSVCEKDASGEPISEAVEVPIPLLKAPEAQIARLDAIVELLQAAKNFKQPICSDKPELLGNWVTVRFESIENSPQGTRPLRKLFRYRSQSALDLGQIAAYWENFTWNAGPVCVQHKNAWWGTPQCWAANADEGKRVIRFAGLEAGIDPDVLGEWVISGSVDPRFGMPGTMQVAKVEGLEWITSRQGPSGLPLLTVDP